MLKSALNYLAGGPVGGAADDLADGLHGALSSDPIVGSNVDVGGIRVRVRKRIGEGGFAFVYAVQEQPSNNESSAGPPSPSSSSGCRSLALKRLLAVDAEKREQIVREISLLKSLRACPHVLQFVTAANVERGFSATRCQEYLLLTELCRASLYDYLSARSRPYPALAVAQIFFQTLEAVGFLHRAQPPILHRDLKVENLLIDSKGAIKLCDLGSATTETYSPDETWNMQQRTRMEEDLAKFTTPMYRAPEMVDSWSNYPVNTASDAWALGCLLFQLCFHHHPFEDGAKLAIINAKYSIPESDTTHRMFHDLIRQTLVVDPSCRPTCQQAQEHLGEVAVNKGWDLEAPVDFEQETQVMAGLVDGTTPAATPATAGQQQQQEKQTDHAPGPSPAAAAAASASAASSSSTSSSSTTSHFMSNFRGKAGNVISNLKDTSKAVVHSLLAPKDVDFHCLTSRIAAMSYPSDGIDLTYKNQIDEIRQILEARHSGNYAVINLTERKYPPSKFTHGTVIDTDWSTSVTPCLEQILNVAMKALEFLGQHKQNVLALHCLDGRSNSALLFSAMLMICKVFVHFQDGLKLFELKRCEPILTRGQRTVLRHLEKTLKTGPSLQLSHQQVSIHSVILEPVPLFTKANDGCRPFVEIYSNSGQLVGSTLKDYASLQLFTPYDGEVVLKTSNIRCADDVTCVVYHARQSLGSSLFGTASAARVDKIRIAKCYFNPAFVPANKTHVRFATHELDNLGDVERIPADFSVTVNFARKEAAKTSVFPYKMPEKKKLDLVFGSRSEYTDAMEMVLGGSASSSPAHAASSSATEGSAPLRPPRAEKHHRHAGDAHKGATTSHMPKPASLVDIAGLGHPAAPHLQEQKTSSLLDLSDPTTKNDDTVINQAAFGANGSSNADSNLLFDLGQSEPAAPAVEQKSDAAFFDLSEPAITATATTQAQKKTANDLFFDMPKSSSSNNNHSDSNLLFDLNSAHPPKAPANQRTDNLMQMPPAKPANNLGMLLDIGAPPASSTSAAPTVTSPHSAPDLFSAAPASGQSDLLGGVDLLKPVSSSSKLQEPVLAKSSSEKLIDDMLNQLNVDPSGPGTQQPTGRTQQPMPPQPQQQRPNYSSSFFNGQGQGQGQGQRSSVPASKANFDDLLGGFKPSSSNGQGQGQEGRTIGEMKKAEEVKTMDPDEARIFEWTHGKSRNIRALLCSLDTVIWPDSRWNKCGMHQLVGFADVKKMHRKAWLAVHPDKQVNTANENLSRLIVIELNDAWAKFQEDEG